MHLHPCWLPVSKNSDSCLQQQRWLAYTFAWIETWCQFLRTWGTLQEAYPGHCQGVATPLVQQESWGHPTATLAMMGQGTHRCQSQDFWERSQFHVFPGALFGFCWGCSGITSGRALGCWVALMQGRHPTHCTLFPASLVLGISMILPDQQQCAALFS